MKAEEQVVVLGRYVYITLPPKKESKIIPDSNTKEALQKELLKKMKRLQIWDVGELANPKLKKGMWVLVNPASLAKAQMVPFDEDETIVRALIQDYDIIHIWGDGKI